ncbi:MAG TPA: hypothetical protein VMG13_19415 [Trebonia sp.]|nr:hypothetical protein [Trebonia sp.]
MIGGQALFDAARPGGTGLVERLARLRRLQVHAFRRLGWGVIDQGVSSLTNFAVVIYVARTLGATELGAFSLSYVTYGFALNASRGIATEPLMVRFSGSTDRVWRRAVASCTGMAIVTGLISGICVLAACLLLRGPARGGFLALGLTLPGLLLQDSWRFAFFAIGRGSQALINDTIWGAVLIPALVVLARTGHRNVFAFVLAWGASAAVAAAVGPFQARVMPNPMNAAQWMIQHRDLGPRYMAENTSQSAANQLRSYGNGVILGLGTVGYLQAATTLMGPFQVVMFGISIVMVAESARILKRSPQRLSAFCVLLSVGLAIAAFLWGVAILVALPVGMGAWLLGPLWHQTYPLVLPTMLSYIGQSASAGAVAGLHALGAAKRSMWVAFFVAVTYLSFNLLGAVVAGAVGSLIGAAIAAWLSALLMWVQLRAALREYGRPPRRPGRHRRAR